MDIHYLQITPEMTLPDISGLKPFLAILVLEERAEPGWRNAVSKWLVKSGCNYMISWGEERSAWDDAVDLANLTQFNNGEIPEDELVLTRGNEKSSLKQFFDEVKLIAIQDCAQFDHTLIVDISGENHEQEFLALYSHA